MLWLTAIATPTLFIAAYVFRENETIVTILIIAGLLPTIITCLGFAYFARFKPEKLQSEDYQIRHETLQIIQQKTGVIEMSPASFSQIVNPAATQLEKREGKQ